MTLGFVAGLCVPAVAWAECPELEVGARSGQVKWFSETKGYGFLRPDDGGKDVFVHHSGLVAAGVTTLADDARVAYVLVEGRDGRQAAQLVTVLPDGCYYPKPSE